MIAKSLKNNFKGIVLMSVSALSVAVGQLLWKLSHGVNLWFIILGFCLYGLGAIFMILAFKHGKLSVVHPVLSLSYVFGIVFGYCCLGELLRPLQFVAIVLIIAGVVMIGGGDNE